MTQHDTTHTPNPDPPAPDSVPEAETIAAVDSTAETSEAPENGAAAQAQPDTADTLAAAQKQAQDYLTGWQRERSDFANYKKRVEREMKDLAHNAAADAVMTLLPIIDDIERAIGSVPDDLKDNAWVGGVSAIHRKFQKVLDEMGITVIDPVGHVFDPSQHEAVATEDSSEVASGHVTTTLQKGYARGERVLRPALVRVAN